MTACRRASPKNTGAPPRGQRRGAPPPGAGRDRVGFLHALLSNDVKSLAPGQGCAATLLDVHGKVQVLLDILVLEDRLLLLLPPGTAHKTLEALDHYLFSEKVALTDVSAGTPLWLVARPEAPAPGGG